jgi:negative regulator of sigma E activity
MSGGFPALLVIWMKTAQMDALLAAALRDFDLAAWIAPLAVFAAALLGAILLVRRWQAGNPQSTVQVPAPAMDVLDTNRRETGFGIHGGF